MLPPNEKLLLGALLASFDARVAVRHYMASSAHFPLLEAGDIFEAVLSLDEDLTPFSLQAISSKLSDRSRLILSEIGFGESALQEDTAAGQAIYCLRALEAKAISVKADALRRRVKELEGTENEAEALKLAEELNQLKKRDFRR